MSTVKKCDICGYLMPLRTIVGDKQMELSVHNRDGDTAFIDCCPECTDKILDFIDVMKTYPGRWRIDIPDEC